MWLDVCIGIAPFFHTYPCGRAPHREVPLYYSLRIRVHSQAAGVAGVAAAVLYVLVKKPGCPAYQ